MAHTTRRPPLPPHAPGGRTLRWRAPARRPGATRPAATAALLVTATALAAGVPAATDRAVAQQRQSPARPAPAAPAQQAGGLPDGFVYLADVDPTIRQDIRYFGADNFVGRRIAGYEAPECILTRQAATALARVQAELAPTHALKVYDCYRPARAVADFARWARDEDDATAGRKAEHFPTVDKADLLRRGFVATVSAHSRGSTVDVSIIALVEAPEASGPTGRRPCRPAPSDTAEAGEWELDFGTSFDCFHERSATANATVGHVARENRDRLVRVMAAAGFRNLASEWWHFQLAPEPFTRTFDFPVRARPAQ